MDLLKQGSRSESVIPNVSLPATIDQTRRLQQNKQDVIRDGNPNMSSNELTPPQGGASSANRRSPSESSFSRPISDHSRNMPWSKSLSPRPSPWEDEALQQAVSSLAAEMSYLQNDPSIDEDLIVATAEKIAVHEWKMLEQRAAEAEKKMGEVQQALETEREYRKAVERKVYSAEYAMDWECEEVRATIGPHSQ